MRKLDIALLCLVIICSSFRSFAQPQECGTVPSPEELARQRYFNHQWQQLAAQQQQTRSGTSVVMIPVQLHIIRRSDGSGGLSIAEFEAALERANEMFLPSSLQFYQCGGINTIDDDTYSPYDYSQMSALDAAHSVANVINIYTTETVTAGTANICGHAQFPGGLDFVMLANSCTNNGSTFAHELGHYFLLYHTHQGGNELADGSNCSSSGDFVCDTPADPQLSTSTNVNATTCLYNGSGTDANGDNYNPETSNFMSYSGKHCRISVSDGQHNRMLAAYNAYRTYLTCGSTPSLDADFAADTEADCGNSLAVQFCDLSAGSPTAWSWDFGDGNSATNQHPSHTYTGAGIYDVSLTVTRGGSSDTETYSAKIKVGTVGIPYTNDFESATALNQWKITNSMKNNISMNAAASNGGSMGLMMDGASVWASPYFYLPAIAANAFDELQNPYYKSLMELCVDATAYENLSLSFDLRQMHFNSSGYTNFRVLVNGSQEGSVYQANTSENWNTITVDLSAYDQTSFTLGFESSVVYENALGAANYLDNINLIGTATLPVEYASFTVAQQGAHVQLDWATLSESNNKGFDVLRSSDQENWQSLGFVPANTTSPATKHYQFMDWQGASQSSDKLYYQLRQVDFDGRTELSDIREVRLQSLSQLLAYPNPSQGELTVIVPRSEPNQVVLQVSDLRGRLILTQKGADDFAGLNQAFRLNLAGLKAGLYLLQVRNGQKHYTQKIVLE